MNSFFKKIIVALLTLEARAILHKYNPKVVAITGSVGKTSAKDAIYTVLSARYPTRKSEKSFNSEVGLPLTILGAPNAWRNPLRWLQNLLDGILLLLFTSPYPEWLVLEVGADRPGDISSLKSWFKTDVVVIMRLPEVPVHVEFFDSLEAVVEEKASLIDTLKPGGTLLLYADDGATAALANRLPAPDARISTFGFGAGAEVRGEDVQVMYDKEHGVRHPVGMRGQISVAGTSLPFEVMGALGTHAALPLVAGAAVGHCLGILPAQIAEGLAGYKPAPGRMRLVPGIKGTLIIDDTYNSSPAAVSAAIDTLARIGRAAPERDITPGRLIAVLGDMLELGRASVAEHRKMGAEAAKVVDLLITVGFRARDMAQGALDNGLKDEQILQYEDSAAAGRELQNLLREGDAVLVKGSQSTRLERVVEEIMLEPERAPDLLVRQDAEWKKR